MEKENYNNCHWNMDTIHFSQFLTLIPASFLLEASDENKIMCLKKKVFPTKGLKFLTP